MLEQETIGRVLTRGGLPMKRSFTVALRTVRRRFMANLSSLVELSSLRKRSCVWCGEEAALGLNL
jgi:hypothetical protein